MRRVLSLMTILFFVTFPAVAKPPAGPSATDRVLDEVEDAVLDELVGEETKVKAKGAGMPPGLAKRDKMPPGLAKKDKTPPGWEKASFGEGQQTEKKEGLIRRWVGKIFG